MLLSRLLLNEKYGSKSTPEIIRRLLILFITDDLSLLDYLFSQYRVNFITGQSMGWPNEDEIIARISFSYEPTKLVRVFLYIKKELLKLERSSL